MARLRRNGEPLTAANVEQRIKELYANVFVVNTGVEQLQTALTSLQTNSAQAIMELNKEIEQLRRQLEQQSATMSPSGRQQPQVGFDLFATATGNTYTTADLIYFYNFAQETIVNGPYSLLLGNSNPFTSSKTFDTPLTFLTLSMLDGSLDKFYGFLKAIVNETKRSVPNEYFNCFKFLLYFRNAIANRRWEFAYPEIGRQIDTRKEYDINDNFGGKIVEVLLPQIPNGPRSGEYAIVRV